jgi:flagellar L-ring protein FlgH
MLAAFAAAIPAAALLAVVGAAPAFAQEAETVTARPAPARQSWTADRRSFVVGDVLTVVIDEYTRAGQHTGTSAERTRAQSADAGVNVPGAGGVVGSATAGTSARGASRDRGSATRETSFGGEIAVRVAEIGTDGTMRIEGNKKIALDGGTQEISLSGRIRPEDVSTRNVIESWRIAELAINHKSGGSLGKPRRGIIGRIIDLVWP